ncbi:hypothetical protein B0I35DRAFT_414754 [Stachybotrys elegans]|uniref:Integral membrane protein n=1 Tax=Stachybotrys elegans TaxID=80388 RepID=A0A8K0S9L6_9HYPO|nr:hypothetical protein B0I35DRAFT_414754 [Stachybotrys elegans]
MDSNRNPPPPNPSDDDDAVDPLQYVPPRPRSPAASSRFSVNPPTPGATSDTADNYFVSSAAAQNRLPQRSLFRLPTGTSTTSATSRPERPARQRQRQPSIRIRRSSDVSLNASVPPPNQTEAFPAFDEDLTVNHPPAHDTFDEGRVRSISEPQRAFNPVDGPGLARHSRRLPQDALPRLTEEGSRPTMEELGLPTSPISPVRSLPTDIAPDEAVPSRKLRHNFVSRMFWPGRNQNPDGRPRRRSASAQMTAQDEYDEEIVDWLDIIDPEVQTLSTLTNVQNSLFVPDLGNWVNRRPTYVLSQRQAEQVPPRHRRSVGQHDRPDSIAGLQPAETIQEEPQGPPTLQRSSTITSRLTDSHYAALPHGVSLEGWSATEKWELDDHVRHMLHSRRSRFKRRMKGFGQYVRRPLGFFVTLYATLITLFGLAWVLFLIGWIYVGDRQDYIVHIIDSVLVALFAIMGDGLAPFRAVDTYHLFFVVRYMRMIKHAKMGKKRSRLQKRKVPSHVRESMSLTSQQGQQDADLTAPPAAQTRPEVERRDFAEQNTQERDDDKIIDAEEAKPTEDWDADLGYLTVAQQKKLEHHQKKLAKSHSFYKPKETFTHYAFPLQYLIAIVILLDCHSCLQISLGATTWGIDYKHRPFAITTVILCVSITCNVTAGIVISLGDRKTRKKDVLTLLDRQELTNDAIKLVEEKRKKEGGDSSENVSAASKSPFKDGSLSKESTLSKLSKNGSARKED